MDTVIEGQDRNEKNETAAIAPTAERVRPQSIRVAGLYFVGMTALSFLMVASVVHYLSVGSMIDLIAHTAVMGYVVLQLYRMKSWAVYAYCVLQVFGSLTCFTAFVSMPFIGLCTAVANVALAYWVYSTTAEIRKPFEAVVRERLEKLS